MSSSVCQGLQSCLEPRLLEPRVLRLKLAQPNSNFPRSSQRPCMFNSNNPEDKFHNEENKNITNTTNNHHQNKNTFDVCESNSNSNSSSNNNGELGSGWSFIQALTNTTQNSKEAVENEKVYIHHLVKRSSSMLSEKSLEMCTESLGCETGSDISEIGSDDIPSPPSEPTNFLIREHSKMLEMYSSTTATTKKLNRNTSFPPPLTSISGSSGCVQVMPLREGGRLVIKAVTISPSNNLFHAERADGRLRLCLWKDNISPTAEEREDDVEKEGGLDYEEEDDDCDSVYWEEEIDGNSESVGGEIGMEKEIPMPSRCKEGGGHGNNKVLWNLKTYNWVATS